MSSENIVENEIDTSSPRMEQNLSSVDGDSSKETPATVTNLVSIAETSHDQEQASEKILTQAEASKAASENPAIQSLALGNHGTFYTQHGVLILNPKVQRERELLAHLTLRPKPKSVSEVEKEKAEKEKAEKKKAEHKRYKAKKKAEAAAKREVEKEAANEVAEEVVEEVVEEVAEEEAEASEPLKSPAELQAEEDARLGDRRMKLQVARQERLEKAASLVHAKQRNMGGV